MIDALIQSNRKNKLSSPYILLQIYKYIGEIL